MPKPKSLPADENLLYTSPKLQESLNIFIREAAAGQCFYLIQDYTGSPTSPGLAICLVACPDDLATDLHHEFDELVKRLFADHGLTPIPRM
jgi:hypothetical protein